MPNYLVLHVQSISSVFPGDSKGFPEVFESVPGVLEVIPERGEHREVK